MVTDVAIRRATDNDIPGIQRVARTTWREAYSDFVSEGALDEMLDYGYSEAFLEDALADTDITLFVAQDEYSIVGYVSCEPPTDGETGQVSIYVSPDYWGEGIGTRLLDRAEEYLDAKGATSLRDVVLADNDAGNAFYEKHFERTDETTVEMGDEEFEANVYTAEI
jgi:ribosomal protein S18 acetylase RimI-like enzyme